MGKKEELKKKYEIVQKQAVDHLITLLYRIRSNAPIFRNTDYFAGNHGWEFAALNDLVFNYDEICNTLPSIKFKEDWEVKIIPPSEGAIVRFIVAKGKRKVNVYFDQYSLLGGYGYPYWEACYDITGDVYRFHRNDVDEMMQQIDRCLNGEEDGEETQSVQ